MSKEQNIPQTLPNASTDNTESEFSLVEDETNGLNETTILEWTAPEFSVYSRNPLYYVFFSIFFVIILGFSVYTRDWFVIPVFFVLAGVFFYYIRIKPKESIYRITQLGIYVNKNFYRYAEVHSFWIYKALDINKLNIIFNKKYLPQLSILIPSIDLLQLKTILAKYIPEQEGRTESFVDRLVRLLKL